MPSFVLSTLHPVRTSFPTRRSSDLLSAKTGLKCRDAGFFRQVQLFPYQTRGLMAQAVIGVASGQIAFGRAVVGKYKPLGHPVTVNVFPHGLCQGFDV